MLLMVERGITGGICNSIHQYARANNKYMKDYDKNKLSSYLNYWDVNNLYGRAMSQKLPVNNFEQIEETSQFNKYFIKHYDDESDEGYFLEVDTHYRKYLYELHSELPFFPKRKNLKMLKSLLLIYMIKMNVLLYIRNLKETLNHGLILKKPQKVIRFNQDDRLKPYIEMNNTKLRQTAKNKIDE